MTDDAGVKRTIELDKAQWARAEALFSHAVALDAAAQDRYLREACGDDAPMLGYVSSLLQADSQVIDSVDATIERTIVGTVRAAFIDDASQADQMKGQMIGPYRVDRLLGAGGMGLVYLAARADEQYDQQVAIKLGRHRLIDPQTEQRLRHERQFLADLDHPNIARLLDGGTTDDGVPYLVMEYIDGVRIDTYCDLHRLNLIDRLRLFQTICAAVHSAHQNLIIHRDIKASNILVTDDGTPKLLDFGIAKLSDAEGAATDGLTREGAVIMTPANGAPEQISGGGITTATDVYGLGLLLYSLLSGVRAYETENRTPAQIAAVICEDDRVSPSRQLEQQRRAAETGRGPLTEAEFEAIAANRGVGLERLLRHLRGDLDTIILTALQKSPERRYRSASALADDIDRHLRSMPIVARADSWRYRATKFVRRHVAAVSAAVLAVLVLSGFTVLLSVQNRHITEERDTAQAVVQFLEDIFMAHDPARARGADISAEEILAEGASRIRNNLADRPEIQSALMGTIGRVYYNLGEYQPSAEMLEQALALRLATDGESHVSVAAARNDLAEVLIRRAEYGRATELLRQSLGVNQLENDGTSPEVATNLFNLANVYLATGELDQAESAVRSSIAIFTQIRDGYGIELAEAKSALGRILQVRGDLDATESLLLEAIEIIGEQGPDHPYMAYYLQNLGVLQRAKGDLPAAEATFQSAIDATRRILGEEHDLLAITLVDQGTLLHRRGDLANAERAIQEALNLGVKIHGERHPRVGLHRTILGMVLHDKGELETAAAMLRQALAIFDASLADDHQYVASAMTELGAVLNSAGRSGEARPILERALDIRDDDYRADHVLYAATQTEYADTLSRLGEFDEARALLDASLIALQQRPGRRLDRVNAAILRLESMSGTEAEGRATSGE